MGGACATPRRSRGSVMFLRTWARGWRDRTVVVKDDISVGSQDEGMTRHHSSSLRDLRLCPSDAPFPPNQLSRPHPPTLPPPCPYTPLTDLGPGLHQETLPCPPRSTDFAGSPDESRQIFAKC